MSTLRALTDQLLDPSLTGPAPDNPFGCFVDLLTQVVYWDVSPPDTTERNSAHVVPQGLQGRDRVAVQVDGVHT